MSLTLEKLIFLSPFILTIIASIWAMVSLIQRMKKHPEDFTKEKLYGDYKDFPISQGVSPKIGLFVLSLGIIILIYTLITLLVE
jgi:hypothetical protein